MEELKNHIKSKNIKKCYLFYGRENFLKKIYEKKIKNLLIDSSFEDMNYTVLEDKNINSEKIIDFCETVPFMSDKKLIIVRNSGFFNSNKKNDDKQKLHNQSKDIDIVDKYIKNIPDNVHIIFSEHDIDKRKNIYKTILKEGYICEFKTPSENDTIKWISKQLKVNNIDISNSTAIYLIRNCGGDLEYLSNEIKKLQSYKNGNNEISIEDIDNICTKSLEAKIFDLISAIGRKKSKQAIKIYRNLILMKEYPNMILNMIARQFKLILQCSILLNDNKDLKEISHIIGIREFIVRECLNQSKNFSNSELKIALEECVDVDLKIKTGEINSEIAVEIFILKHTIG